jgi:PAS domain S-box-containing protein
MYGREQRRPPEALSGSAKRMQLALQAARVAAWEFDVRTATLQYAGTLVGAPHSDATTQDEQKLAQDLVAHASLGSGPYSSEFHQTRPDGSVVWIRNQGETVFGADGRAFRVVGVTLDITERKEAEELLRTISAGVSISTGNAFCRSLTQHLCTALKTDLACIGELDSKNPNLVEKVSISAGDKFWQEYEHPLSGTPCEVAVSAGRCFYPEDVQRAFPTDRTLVELGLESYVGIALKGSDGEPVGVMCVMNRGPLKNAVRAEALLNILASRTAAELERGRWELALRESENQNQAIVRALPDLMVVSDRQNTILDLYAKDLKDLILSRESLRGEKLDAVLGPEVAKVISALWTSEYTEPAVTEYSLSISGQLRFYEARTVNFGDDKLLTIVRNITGKKRAEIALEESQRFAKRIAQTSLNVLFIYDLIERRNVYANERTADIIGYTPKEVEDMGEGFVSQLLHPDDLVQLPTLANEYARRKDGEVFEHVFRMRHKNGEWRWVHRSATIFNRTPDGRPKQILGSVTDITEYKRAEEELRDLSARLFNVQDQARRRIARELHDVTGQNLAAIAYNLEAMEKSPRLSLSMKNTLAQCRALCKQSLEEIRTLSYVLHPPLLDDLGLVRALSWYVEGFVQRAGIEVILEVQNDVGRLPLEMETDLFRVVQEGLTNVRRHSHNRKAIIRLSRQQTQLILQIEDRRSDSPAAAKVEKHSFDEGPGVGIPGMRERLRQHGGSLEIRSESTGTTLTAVVPLAQRPTPLSKSASQTGG